MRITRNFIAALVMMFVGQCSAFGQQQPTLTPTPSPEASKLTELPESVLNVELKSATGGEFKLSSYKGYVVLIHLWATWCGPCRLETPELVKLQQTFESQGLRVIELSTENPDASKSAVRDYMRIFGVKHQVGWVPKNVALTLMQSQGAIPQTFLIARDGRILKRFIGFSRDSTPALMKRATEEALKTNEQINQE